VRRRPFPPDVVRHFAPRPPQANKLTGMSRTDVVRKYGSARFLLGDVTQPPTPAVEAKPKSPAKRGPRRKQAAKRANKARTPSKEFAQLPLADQVLITLFLRHVPDEFLGMKPGRLLHKVAPDWPDECNAQGLKFRELKRDAVRRAKTSARKLLRAGKLPR
jgi:hypothetical protein